jgi:hypothetical protein
MGKFVKGDVVIIPFPFTDLSGNKKRPAFVVADLSGDDIIVCQITSKFKSDSLNKNMVLSVAGRLCETKTHDALNSIISIVSP